MVSSRLVRQLGLVVKPHPESIRGVGNVTVSNLVGQTLLTFGPGPTSRARINAPALVLDEVVGRLPQVKLPPEVRSLTAGLVLADAGFDRPGPIDVLLGADVLGRVLLSGNRTLQPGGLVTLETVFGYAVMGLVLAAPPPPTEEGCLVGTALSEAVQRFWEIEEPPTASRMSPEQEECERFYQNNTGRLCSGRFITRLPLLIHRPPLGASREMAEKRLVSMERRMRRDALFRQKYVDFMREYEGLGHMSVARTDWSTVEHCFLPHHAVLKSPESKIRVVFDGSASTSTGVSLNQCLHAGPKLHKDITDILTNFRKHQVVFVADIRMMFRQTVIHPDDRRYQLILWRESPDEPMLVYELNTNTYGLKSSPYISIRTLLELASRERLRFPRASAILERDLFVDDVCTGANSVEEALVLRDELVELLRTGGYELRKWLSNSPAVVAGLPEDHQQDPHLFENVESPHMLSVLGVQYRPVQDVFTYRVELDSPRVWTKRLVLSTVARTYDPNGWIAPVIFTAKAFMQRLWMVQLGWDDPLSGNMLSDWEVFFSTLPEINQVELPRKLLPAGKCRVTLHGFCDASERGYAAAVYLRTVSSAGSVDLHLVMAKSKVAPLRTRLTIPKMELSGAALLVRLLNHVASTLKDTMNLEEIVYAWTDSQIVLCWLQSSFHTLEVFVANRVSQIQNSETALVWRHVPGELNPADVASRGCTAPELVAHSLWWRPDWLLEPETLWPASCVIGTPSSGLGVHLVETAPVSDTAWLLERYSSLDKLVGVTAWVKRFIHNCRHPDNRSRVRVLATEERNAALHHWIRVVQEEHFGEVLKPLRQGRPKLPKAIARLNPFIDESGTLRVGGRLRNASLLYSVRHPILLPKKGHLVELLVIDRHIKNSHASCNALLGILQRDFWILNSRRVIRSIVFRCLPCFRLKAATMQPQMGDLPPDRVNEARTFSRVGTDFAGPFLVKTSRLRNAKVVKAYLCVFVCLSTKAAHLELVGELTTEAFIAALDRFVSRRGLPSLIRSDCGTNYKGADRYLQDVVKFLFENKIDIGTDLSRRGITWTFDPPGCPHWGGIWEACVKQAKAHMYRVVGQTVLTFEELATLFCRIEAVLNSRPLCPLSSDPNDLEALSPGHFLIGQPLAALPEHPLRDVPSGRLSRYQMLQQMAQNFWTRWSLEYLHVLQQRLKWTDKTSPPRVGDLVLVKDANLPPLRWRRGRIVNLFPGKDGTPRFAEVMVGDLVLKRAVATLSRLPLV
jgi:hypothetical protein